MTRGTSRNEGTLRSGNKHRYIGCHKCINLQRGRICRLLRERERVPYLDRIANQGNTHSYSKYHHHTRDKCQDMGYIVSVLPDLIEERFILTLIVFVRLLTRVISRTACRTV